MNPAICWPLKRNFIRAGKNNHTFGMVRRQWKNGKLVGRPHQGWDFDAPIGSEIFAVSDGEVVMVRNKGAYGLQIILRFEFDFDGDGDIDVLFAAYCHLSRVDVAVGDKVTRGQVIGLTGDSGNAKGMAETHLHFEVRTQPIAGRGLANRYSPMVIFDDIPLRKPIKGNA